MIQTSHPTHRVLDALRGGRPAGLMQTLVAERAKEGFPPAGDLIAVDLEGAPEEADGELRAVVADGGEVLGPAPVGDRERWLIQGAALHPVRIRLRAQVQRWRDAGVRVRVDADPIDL